MRSTEKEISFQTTNTYSVLNTLTANTKTIWFVCHGLGYLSRYFLKYFKGLNADENYIIAPQAPSKFYLGKNFKHVGACWLTRENTITETENIMCYYDQIFNSEGIINSNKNIIMLGYSQGVSVVSRYVASRKINCSKLVLLSGSIPKELKTNDFKFLDFKTKVHYIYGDKDEYINEERIAEASKQSKALFGSRLLIQEFDGAHEVKPEIINSLA